MRLTALEVDGFGKLDDRRFAFGPGLNVVYGENEAGKSTIANAVVACLYGVGRKGEREQWRPWSGANYAARLHYTLADGRAFEIHRDFERDPRGVRAFDRNGNDRAGELAVGKAIVPGYHHLGVPLEVFLNAACAMQQSVAIETAKASRIGASLARALDGGPREDAALGALKRLDDALRTHVGTERATKNAPLRRAQERAAAAAARAESAREHVQRLSEMRSALEREVEGREALQRALAEHERRARALRAATLRTKIASLREIHDDVANLQAERARYDDVATFASERVAELETRYHLWRERAAVALAAEEESAATRLSACECDERDLRALDGGAVDEGAFARLEADAAEGAVAQRRAAAAALDAASARRQAENEDPVLRAALATAATLAVAAIGGAIAHWWLAAAGAAVLTAITVALMAGRIRTRRSRRAQAAELQARADEALATEAAAAARVASALMPLDVPNVAELGRRRDRFRELHARAEAAAKCTERARAARAAATEAARAFEHLAWELNLNAQTYEATLAQARNAAARARERAGIDASLHMLEVRRVDILGAEDAYALAEEFAHLSASGVEDSPFDLGISPRLFEEERLDLERRMRAAEAAVGASSAELRAAEAGVADLPALDEETAGLRAEVARLEAFERAVTLARSMLEERTRDAHETFARRLEDYAARILGPITQGRYAEVRIDPASFELKVRVPETHAFVELDRLSTGTREQTYLVVRFAIARMLAEGLETPPLLLDDPFAFWDAGRLTRCLPILVAGARDGQAIVFTSSAELADAAHAAGAHRIDLESVALVR